MLVTIRPPGTSSGFDLEVSADGTWAAPSAVGGPKLGSGWWALPGLADAHVHLAADRLVIAPGDPASIRRRAFACLDRGTFLVIDKGWGDDVVVATLTGRTPHDGPDWEAAGGVIRVADGYYPGFGRETDTDGLAAAVAAAAAEGKGWVKLIGDWPRKGVGARANFDETALATAVAVAHAGGARVAIHSMAPEVPSLAVMAGVDSIEHGLFLTARDLGVMAGRGAAWVPTLVAMTAVMDQLGAGSSGGRMIRQGLDNAAALLADVPEGVALLAGTDLAADAGDVCGEVEALVRAGLEPVRAVEAAAGAARAYLGRPSGFAPGLAADAVFFDTDPYEDPSVLGRPVAVMRAGRRRR